MSTSEITVTRQNICYTTTLATLSCGNCGIPFAIAADMLDRLQANGETFSCPNGDRISYRDSENARLKRQLDNTRAAYDRERDRAAAAERSASAYKGQVTRIRKRVANGVCPCCHRTFQQLARHMKAKHPGYEQQDA